MNNFQYVHELLVYHIYKLLIQHLHLYHQKMEPMLQLLDKLEEVEGDKRDKNIKSFVDTVSSIKKLGKQADKTLDAMIKAEESWFVGGLMKLLK